MSRPVHRPRSIALSLSGFTALVAIALQLGACNGDRSSDPQSVRSTSILSGDSQTVVVGVALPTPLAVRVLGGNGSPLANTPVSWAIASGGGTLRDTSSTTDASGKAEMTYTAGTTVGSAKITAQASIVTQVTFTVTLTAGPPAKIAKFGFDSPAALAGSAFPLIVKVSDQYGNGLPGTAVTWASAPDGTVSAASSTTDASGLARTTLTLPQRAGTYTVTADAGGLGAVTFTITAI